MDFKSNSSKDYSGVISANAMRILKVVFELSMNSMPNQKLSNSRLAVVDVDGFILLQDGIRMGNGGKI